MLHAGKLLSRQHLAEHLYSNEKERDSNVIEVHINRLRGKLGRGVIETRRGQGYRFRGVSE
jgi:DNA-binding response OmpR family regulator